MGKNGVVISINEIYAELQEIKSVALTVRNDVKNIQKTDERSRQALELANDAVQKAHDLEKQLEKLETRRRWTIGILVAVFGVIVAIVELLMGGLVK